MLRPMAAESEGSPLMHDEAGPSVKAAFSACGDRDGDVYLVKAEGELDAGTEDILADELNRAVATDAKHILLDLSDVAFIDSTGVALLVRTNRQVAAGRLRLLPVEGQVRRVLELTGVAGYLEFVTEPSDGVRPRRVRASRRAGFLRFAARPTSFRAAQTRRRSESHLGQSTGK